MSKSNAWMPLYVGDYMRDTLHLDATEHGAYLMLIMHYWNTGPVRDDDRALANITRAGAQWPQIAPTIRAFFTSEGGFLKHKRIDAERAKSADLSDKRRAAGQARHPCPGQHAGAARRRSTGRCWCHGRRSRRQAFLDGPDRRPGGRPRPGGPGQRPGLR
jgi:uncharacterized protein YdaU (DUF1376 family)